MGEFLNYYPELTGTKLDDCVLCHDMATMARNPYGQDVEAELAVNGNDAWLAFSPIEWIDSDGDTFMDLEELWGVDYPEAGASFPGDPSDVPSSICIDQDGDGHAAAGNSPDCFLVWENGEPDCDDNDPQIHVGVMEVCNDGIDNNCNGLIDCQDESDWASAPNCIICTDADDDGYAVEGGGCGPIDCNDADSTLHPGAIENCSDGIDNDCNNLIDCYDADCSGEPAYDNTCIPEADREKGKKCSDGIDNDCDGLVDGSDPDC